MMRGYSLLGLLQASFKIVPAYRSCAKVELNLTELAKLAKALIKDKSVQIGE